MMLQLLREVEERSERQEKTIVFSQFTSFLDLVEPFLRESGIKFVRCKWQRSCQQLPLIDADDGSMPNDKRQESLETIRSSTTIRVILISFKAGSTGKFLFALSLESAVLIERLKSYLLQQRHLDGFVVEPSVKLLVLARICANPQTGGSGL